MVLGRLFVKFCTIAVSLELRVRSYRKFYWIHSELTRLKLKLHVLFWVTFFELEAPHFYVKNRQTLKEKRYFKRIAPQNSEKSRDLIF